MLITNKNKSKQIKVFLDEDHSTMLKYYDILENDLSPDCMLKEMLKLISEDKNFYDPYLTAAEILFYKGKNKEAFRLLEDAYTGAVSRIVDAKGRWPKEIPWGYLENRHVMRAIEEYASICWEIGNIDQALDIFKKLLRTNPIDNQGIRFNILAIKMGLNLEEWQKPFEEKSNGKVYGLNAFKVNKWFEDNASKFPDEFDWLLKIYAQIDNED